MDIPTPRYRCPLGRLQPEPRVGVPDAVGGLAEREPFLLALHRLVRRHHGAGSHAVEPVVVGADLRGVLTRLGGGAPGVQAGIGVRRGVQRPLVDQVAQHAELQVAGWLAVEASDDAEHRGDRLELQGVHGSSWVGVGSRRPAPPSTQPIAPRSRGEPAEDSA